MLTSAARRLLASNAVPAATAAAAADPITRYVEQAVAGKGDEPIFAPSHKTQHWKPDKSQVIDYDSRDAVYGRESFSLNGLRVVPVEMRVQNEGALRNSLQRDQAAAARSGMEESEASADAMATAGWKKEGRKRVIDMDAVEGLPDTVAPSSPMLSDQSPLTTPAPRDTAEHGDLSLVGRYFDLQFSASEAAAPAEEQEEEQDDAAAATTLTRYPLPERLEQEFACTGRDALMVRAPAANAIKSLVAFEAGEYNEGPEAALLFTGQLGQGKAASLAHVVHHCHSHNWLTLVVANPERWATKQPVVTPSPHDDTLFDQHDFSAEVMHGLIAMNKPLLGSLPCQFEPDASMLTKALEKRRPTTLLELARRATTDREGATGPAVWMLHELAKLADVPVLVAVHGAEALYRETDYFFRGERLAPEQMRLMRAFRYFDDADAPAAPVAALENGFFAATMTNAGVSAIGGSRALRPFLHHAPCYSALETESALRHYRSAGYIGQHLSEQDVCEMHTKTGGNPRELRREIPTALL